MRIIGGKDYYDGGQAYGIDRDVVLVRDHNRFVKKEDFFIEMKGFHSQYDRDLLSDGTRFVEEPAAVIFCGKLTNFVIVRASRDHVALPDRDVYCFDETSYREWRRSVGWPVNKGWRDMGEGARIATFFGQTLTEDEKDRLIAERISIAVLASHKKEGGYRSWGAEWAINSDRLADVRFFEVMPMKEAFQELSMYIGCFPLAPKPVEITDAKIKVAKHGFDKHSFRKSKAG